MNMAGSGVFQNVALKPPRPEDLDEISRDLGLQCTAEELEAYREHMGGMLKGYERLSRMISPTLPVKYPRTPGYRPADSENEYNAWYRKTDIEGASEGILKGKKVAIKDNVCVAGVPMMNGSAILDGYVPEVDATVVTRILDAGGRIVGKTNCEHFCYSGSSITCDLGPVLNPVDKTRSSGGSSSGSAVVVATGEVDMAIAGDQGGSIRIPSSWCGMVGLKPTFGLVPYTGAGQIEVTIDHLGPIARTVSDCALLLEAIAGYDEGRDPRQPRDLVVPKYSQLLNWDPANKNNIVGLVKEGLDFCEPEVQQRMNGAIQHLSNKGDNSIIRRISIPLHSEGLSIWGPIATDGGYECMVPGAGAGYLHKGFYLESMMNKLSAGYKSNAQNLSETMKLVCLFSEYVKKNYGNKFYAKAQNMSVVLKEAYDKALEECDVLIMPTLPYTAPKLPSETSTIQERLAHCLGMVKNVAPFDATGHPAITINMCKSVQGLPIGMMIVGKPFDEVTVLQYAYKFEQLFQEII